MKLTKGISVRPKPGTNKWYVYVRYKNQRLAFQHDSEAAAMTQARSFEALKHLGKFGEIFAPKKDAVPVETTTPPKPAFRRCGNTIRASNETP